MNYLVALGVPLASSDAEDDADADEVVGSDAGAEVDVDGNADGDDVVGEGDGELGGGDDGGGDDGGGDEVFGGVGLGEGLVGGLDSVAFTAGSTRVAPYSWPNATGTTCTGMP